MQLAVFEAEGTDADGELLGEAPELVGDEPLVLDLFLRLRRTTPGDQPLGFDSALELQALLYGPPADPALLLEDLDAMDGEYRAFQARASERSDGELGKRRKR